MTRGEEVAWAAGLFEGEGCVSRRAAKIDEALVEMRGRVYKPGRRATPQRELASR